MHPNVTRNNISWLRFSLGHPLYTMAHITWHMKSLVGVFHGIGNISSVFVLLIGTLYSFFKYRVMSSNLSLKFPHLCLYMQSVKTHTVCLFNCDYCPFVCSNSHKKYLHVTLLRVYYTTSHLRIYHTMCYAKYVVYYAEGCKFFIVKNLRKI